MRGAAAGGALLLALLVPSRAHAGPFEDAVQGLASDSEEKVVENLRKLAVLDDARAWPVLDALCDDRLRVAGDGRAYVWDSKTHDARDPLTLAVVTPQPFGLKEVETSNEIRR